MTKDDNFLDERTLSPEQAASLERAMEKEPLAIKTRVLKSRFEDQAVIIGPYASGGGATCNSYNFHLLPTNERMFFCLCATIVVIVAIMY